MSKVEIVSSCLIQMASHGHPGTVELTPWELRYLLLLPVQKGILFHKPEHSEQLIDHLKRSLSRTLDFFPTLSGRLGTVQNNDDGTVSFFVDWNDAGVEFTHAAAPAVSISDIMEPDYIPEIVSSFFPLNDTPNHEGVSKPLWGVQVTELADGLFMGCTANHSVIDGTSFWHFLNSWSEISRGLDRISKAPVFDPWFPSNITDENRRLHLPPLDKNATNSFIVPPLLERFFRFSKDNLVKLKVKANYEAGSSEISTFQALMAHLWRGVIRCRHQLRKADNFSKKLNLLVLAVGARTRIPLPDGYFGNTSYADQTAITDEDILQNGLGFAARKINELVRRQTRDAVIKFVEDWIQAPAMVKMGPFEFIVSSSPRYDIYGCDFGWGKPITVRSGKAQKCDGKMTVYPGAEPGGMDVEVCLPPETLKALAKDEEFMEAVTI